METVHHHGRETAYTVTDRGGDGPPAIFIHGSGGSGSVWRAQTRLADRFPVVRMDLSGHGESTDVEADPGWGTRSAYASDVLAVAEETGAEILVGNSLGGAVALHVALYRGFDPTALVLVGTGAKLAVLDDLLQWLRDDFEQAIDFVHRPGHLFSDADEEMINASKTVMRDCGRSVTERDYRTCHTFDVRSDLERIEAPTLAVVGSEDRLTPPWYHEYLADEIPNGDWIVIEHAAHLVMLERPERFNEILAEFVSQFK